MSETAIERAPQPMQLVGQDELFEHQIVTAKKFPREMAVYVKQLPQLVTATEEDAGKCIYAYTRGGKIITGPSIRFSECVQFLWKNSRVMDGEIVIKEKTVMATAGFMDLENNTGIMRKAERKIVGRDGQRFNEDMIYLTGLVAMAIARRNARLDGIPRPFWSPAYDAAINMVGDPREIPTRTRPAALAFFEKHGVSAEQMCKILHVEKVEDIWIQQVIELRGLRTAIEEGDMKIEEIVRHAKPIPRLPQATRSAPESPQAKAKRTQQAKGRQSTPAAGATAPEKKPPAASAASKGRSAAISENEYKDLLLFINDQKLYTSHALKIARDLGHTGSLKELPKAMLKPLLETLEKKG